MKSHIKYGIATFVGWNIALLLGLIIRSRMKGVSISYFFDDGTGGVAISIFLVAWSLIWFGIGCHARKSFLAKKNMYAEMFPTLDKKSLEEAFRRHYFSKQAKMFTIVFATAIPWYVIGYVEKPLAYKDFIVIGPLMALSILCFFLYKKYSLPANN
ncbi:MAG: hypothetical protein Q4D56_09295 [Bacteroides sp.]|nr:hypothetical protein [Bacteroides sp.]